MKQGLSLRVSQHLALTPQLQQSIRLLQLSTLELGQEIQQMLDDNPFLEVQVEDLPEEFGPAAGTEARSGDADGHGGEAAYEAAPGIPESAAGTSTATEAEPAEYSEDSAANWDGDGTTETIADDGEWGGEAPAARRNTLGENDEVDATDLARGNESLQSWLHRQALALRLSELDRAALRYLIESINDDGYLEDSLASLAGGLAPDADLEQQEELVHRFTWTRPASARATWRSA
jgi:RNA polymerase sigma-54 factor